jgi:hypothetical protein
LVTATTATLGCFGEAAARWLTVEVDGQSVELTCHAPQSPIRIPT